MWTIPLNVKIFFKWVIVAQLIKCKNTVVILCSKALQQNHIKFPWCKFSTFSSIKTWDDAIYSKMLKAITKYKIKSVKCLHIPYLVLRVTAILDMCSQCRCIRFAPPLVLFPDLLYPLKNTWWGCEGVTVSLRRCRIILLLKRIMLPPSSQSFSSVEKCFPLCFWCQLLIKIAPNISDGSEYSVF